MVLFISGRIRCNGKHCGYLQRIPRGTKMREEALAFCLLLSLTTTPLTGCGWERPNISGVWKGSIESSDKRGHRWNGPAELTLNQNGDVITGTLAFTRPQAGRIQVPISSGVVSKDAVVFSGQSQLPLGTIELTFHGKADGNSLTGTADITLRAMLLGGETNPAALSLQKQ
jgi:hypothetical protein